MFVVKKDSWHYKFNRFFSNEWIIESKGRDFCSYFRMTFFRLLVCASLLAFTLLIIYVAITAFKTFIVLLSFIVFAFLIMVVPVLILIYFEDKPFNNRPPGLFRIKYKSWKEKYCPLIRFE